MYIDDSCGQGREIWSISLLAAALVGLFWFCWYLIVGHIPSVELPILGRVSRLWDFLIGPVFLGFVWLIRRFDDGTDDCFALNALGTLVVGLGCAIAICTFLKFGVFASLLVLIVTIPAIISVLILLSICMGVGWLLSKTPLW